MTRSLGARPLRRQPQPRRTVCGNLTTSAALSRGRTRETLSAYIVDMDLIRYLLGAATGLERGAFYWYHGGSSKELHAGDDLRAAAVGQMLWSENVRSVSDRYPNAMLEGGLPGPVDDERYIYEHRAWRDPQFNPVQVLKAAQCLEYQSCEHAGWESSEAAAFLEALRRLAIHSLPGYEAAEWGAPKERTNVIALSQLLGRR